MNIKNASVWVPFGYSVALSVIAVIGNLSSPSNSAGMLAFLCFLPMCFFFVGNVLTDNRQRIETLESRIKELEAEKAVA